MPERSVLSMKRVTDFLDKLMDEVSISDEGTAFQRKRHLAFLQGIRTATRAFCLSDDDECDYVCPPEQGTSRPPRRKGSRRK